MRTENKVLIFGLSLMAIGILFAVAYGQNATNSTNEMLFGDRWDCGYINTTITLDDIRSCYRD